jgi:hypothetical protein
MPAVVGPDKDGFRKEADRARDCCAKDGGDSLVGDNGATSSFSSSSGAGSAGLSSGSGADGAGVLVSGSGVGAVVACSPFTASLSSGLSFFLVSSFFDDPPFDFWFFFFISATLIGASRVSDQLGGWQLPCKLTFFLAAASFAALSASAMTVWLVQWADV